MRDCRECGACLPTVSICSWDSIIHKGTGPSKLQHARWRWEVDTHQDLPSSSSCKLLTRG